MSCPLSPASARLSVVPLIAQTAADRTDTEFNIIAGLGCYGLGLYCDFERNQYSHRCRGGAFHITCVIIQNTHDLHAVPAFFGCTGN